MNEIQIFKKPDFSKVKAFQDNIKNPYMGVVYACEFGEQVKIGSSGKPYTHLMALVRQAESYGNLRIGSFAITPLHTNFRDNEKLLHSLFATSRVEGTELFSVRLLEAIDRMSELKLRDDSVALSKKSAVVTEGLKDIVTGKFFKGTSFDASSFPIAQVSRIGGVRGYLDKNLNVWLNAEDVAKGFGFTQVKKGVIYVRWNTVNTYLQGFGFSQQVGKDSYIPENMVYRLGFKANNEVAQAFQTKLADEVLPAIRKTGGYMVAKQDDTPETIMARAVLIAQDTMSRQKEQIGKLQAENAFKDKQIVALTPDAEYTRRILTAEGTYLTNVIAKEMGMSAVTLNKKLQGIGAQYKERGIWVLTHKYQDKGYTKTTTHDFLKSDGSVGTRIQTEWTETGRRWLHKLHGENRI